MLTRSSRFNQAPPSAVPEHIDLPQHTPEAARASADAGWFSSDDAAMRDASRVLASIARQMPRDVRPAAHNLSAAAPHDPAAADAHGWTPLHQAAAQGDAARVELLFAEVRGQIAAGPTGSLGLNQPEWEAIGRFAEESAYLGGVLGNCARHESPTGRIEQGPSAYWFKSANYLSIKLQALRAAGDAFAHHSANLSQDSFAAWQHFEQSLVDYTETWGQVRADLLQVSQLPLSHEALQRHADALVAHTAVVPLVNQADERGNTPLHAAVACGQWPVVQLLMRYGANLDQPNHTGVTPRDRWRQMAQDYHDKVRLQEHDASMANLAQLHAQLANLLARLNRP